MASRMVKEVSNYFRFTFEPLHSLYRRISKLLNECTLNYLSSNKLTTDKARKGTEPFVKIVARVLGSCNLLLRAIELTCSSLEFIQPFSKKGGQMHETDYLQRRGIVRCWKEKTTERQA